MCNPAARALNSTPHEALIHCLAFRQMGLWVKERDFKDVTEQKPPRWKAYARHLERVAVRAVIATAILWVLLSIPLPLFTPQIVIAVHVPIAIFLFVVYLGKLLYDTFFYEHYQR